MAHSDNDDIEREIFGCGDLFSDGSNDDEEEHDKPVKDEPEKKDKKEKDDKPKKRRTLTNTCRLNYARLNGPTGLRLLKKNFENFQFKGENHEKEDLTRIVQKLRHWMCYQLYPKYSFEDNMAELERLGSQKQVQVLLKKMRMGIDSWGDQPVNIGVNENNDSVEEQGEQNNFESWWQEQMAQVNSDDDLEVLALNDNGQADNDNIVERFTSSEQNGKERSTATPESQPEITLTSEQLERIARNKKLAEERRLQRIEKEKTGQTQSNAIDDSPNKSLPLN